MSLNADTIERAAMNGEDMDEELCLPDMWLFLAFRELYRQFRSQAIGKEQASWPGFITTVTLIR